MNENWAKEIEKGLEQRFNQFLRAKPYQDFLLKKQEHQDEYNSLIQQRKYLQEEAEEERQKLMAIVKKLRSWQSRSSRAKQAGAEDLAKRADEYLTKLMIEGRQSWARLDQLGKSFRNMERKISEVLTESTQRQADPDQKWTEFETQELLDKLKRNHQSQT